MPLLISYGLDRILMAIDKEVHIFDTILAKQNLVLFTSPYAQRKGRRNFVFPLLLVSHQFP